MNQFTMTNKIKRLLKKKGLKGWLKPVDSLENCHFVLVEDKRCVHNSFVLIADDYKTLLERGLLTYQPDIVHFLVNSNKRNVLNVNYSILIPRLMDISRV